MAQSLQPMSVHFSLVTHIPASDRNLRKFRRKRVLPDGRSPYSNIRVNEDYQCLSLRIKVDCGAYTLGVGKKSLSSRCGIITVSVRSLKWVTH